MSIHRPSLSGGTPERLARATARRQLKFFQQKASFFRDSGVLLKSKKVCRQWDGDEETETEIERERRGKPEKRRRLFASARRAWPATAAEVVKRLVLTTSASCLGRKSQAKTEGCQEKRYNSVKPK